MKKIISNYSITVSEDHEAKEYNEAAPIIKVPIFKTEEKTIEAFDMSPPPPPPTPPEPQEPKLQLKRNIEGIVVGIEVYCSCGENILIKLDYK